MIIEKIENKKKEIVDKFIEAHRRAMCNPHMRFVIYLDSEKNFEPYIFEDIVDGNSFPSAAFDAGDIYFGEYCERSFDLLGIFESGAFIEDSVKSIISKNETERFYENQFEYRLNDLKRMYQFLKKSDEKK